MKTLAIITTIAIGFVVEAQAARTWEKVTIPEATCGNGQPYDIFINTSTTQPNKWLIEFMGGGACWSAETCYGDQPLAQLAPVENPTEILLQDNEENSMSPFKEYGAVFFPYCTGDVFAGYHTGKYEGQPDVAHMGYSNTEKAFEYLKSQSRINFEALTDVVVYGYSAGAIGALHQAFNIEKMVPVSAKKLLIADSPGLHFANDFWRKFSMDMNHDFASVFARPGLMYTLDEGLVAARMGPVFETYKSWNIGILQTTQDLVMSTAYGGLSPEQHRELVLSEGGIAKIAEPFANVKVWIRDGTEHSIFMNPDFATKTDMVNNQTAWDFVTSLSLLPAPTPETPPTTPENPTPPETPGTPQPPETPETPTTPVETPARG